MVSSGGGDAAPIVIRRDIGTEYFLRTWAPLANYGKNHFILEWEDLFDPAGNLLEHNFVPRVNWYFDEGKAVEGMGAGAH